MIAHATSKGQIVIPAAVRRKLGIRKGTRIEVEVGQNGRQVILTPITREYIHSIRGKYKGKGIFEEFLADRRRERDL
jgi:AbrB family looped-hinge helix DNA binding protein